MLTLSPAAENRLFLASIGITAFAAVGLMGLMLDYYRDHVEVEDTRPKTQYITQKTEDSLKISTLQKLFHSDSYSVKETAARIVCDRAIHDDATVDMLLRELARPEYERRDRGLRTLIFLTEMFNVSAVHRAKTYDALVTCLSQCLDDVDHDDLLIDASSELNFDPYYYRDAVERNALHLLAALTMEHGVAQILRAGFVQRWLVKQPWGQTESDVQINFSNYWLRYYNDLTAIMREIHGDTAGRKQLVQWKLVEPARERRRESMDMVWDEERGEEAITSANVDTEPRRREQNTDGERVRRRHREAMVFNDGNEPVGRGDIFQREDETMSIRSPPVSPFNNLWELRLRDEDEDDASGQATPAS